MKNKLTFKDIYKTPFTLEFNKVFTVDYNMAFDFFGFFNCGKEPFAKLNTRSKKNIVSCLNGQYKIKNEYDYKYENGVIYIKNPKEPETKYLKFILIRGWGNLIGIGGFKLKEKQAIKIQDNFANWIIQTLKNAEEKDT